MRGEWQVGDTVQGLYEVLRVHSTGAMGMVYQVHHLMWDVDLAVKSPRPDMFVTADDRNRFTAEAQHWVSLGLHPHVCACHYVRTIDEVPRIFAEYLPGGSVAEGIADGRFYRGEPDEVIARILDIGIQSAWGLQHAHDRGLVHQDVKPANVLLDRDGTAKVTDFGVARARALAAPAAGLAEGGGGSVEHGGATTTVLVDVVGMTRPYASPEQLAGQGIGRRSDVFSLGVSIVEMFTGGLHWLIGPAAPEALRAHMSSGSAPIVPPAVAEVLDRCLRTDPGERPRTMAEVADALAHAYQEHLGRAYPRDAPHTVALRPDELTNHALSLLDLEQWKEADRAFADALAADPRHLLGSYNDALVRWRRGLITDDEVVRRVELAREVATDRSQADYLLAQIHLERGDVSAASDLLASDAGPAAADPDVAILRERLAGPHRPADRDFDFRDAPGRVARLRPSSSGAHVLIGGEDQRPTGDLFPVTLWDVARRRPVWSSSGHTSWIYTVDMAEGANVAVSGGYDKTVRIWDLTDGSSRGVLTGHTGAVNAVSVSADGRRAVSGSHDGTVRFWDLATGQERVLEGHTDVVDCVSINADGTVAVSGARDGTARVWDLAAGGCRSVLDATAGRAVQRGTDEQVKAVAISDDGAVVVSGDQGGRLSLWGAGSGYHRKFFRAHPTAVTMVSLSADVRHAVTGCDDGTVRLWRVGRGRCLRTYEAHREHAQTRGRYVMVMAAVFTGDGDHLVTAAGDKTLRQWALPRDHVAPLRICRPRSHADLAGVAARADGLLEQANEALAQRRHHTALACIRQARDLPGFERHPTILQAWRNLGSVAQRVGVRAVWPAASLLAHTGQVTQLAVGEESPWTVSTGEDAAILLWEVGLGRRLTITHDHVSKVDALAVTRNGRRLFSGSVAGATAISDLVLDGETWQHTLTPVQTDRARAGGGPLALSPDGRFGLMVDAAMNVALADFTAPGRAVRVLPFQPTRAMGLCLSSDVRLALTGCDDGYVRVWDLVENRRVGGLRHRQLISVSLSADDTRAVSTGWDRMVRVWRLDTGECVSVLEGHSEAVHSAAFSPDGRFVASAGADHAVRLWDVATGECLHVLDLENDNPSVVRFTPDSRFVVAGTTTGPIRVWEVDWEIEIPEEAYDNERARPLLTRFLAEHTPMTPGAEPAREGAPTWEPSDYDALLARLARAGLGWVGAAPLQAHVDEMAASWSGPPPLTPYYRVAPGWPAQPPTPPQPDQLAARSDDEADVYIALQPCPDCGYTELGPADGYAVVLGNDGAERHRIFWAACRNCACSQRFTFGPSAKMLKGTAGRKPEYGAPFRSTLVDAGQWLAYAESILDGRRDLPHDIGGSERQRMRWRIETAIAAIEEAGLFVEFRKTPKSAIWTAQGRRLRSERKDLFRWEAQQARLGELRRTLASLADG